MNRELRSQIDELEDRLDGMARVWYDEDIEKAAVVVAATRAERPGRYARGCAGHLGATTGPQGGCHPTPFQMHSYATQLAERAVGGAVAKYKTR